ncbi:MAG: hypothetical protein AB1896_23245, partial [Thermodesulfobacteriota bacterium]
ALTRGLVSAELGRRLGVDRFRGGLILQDPVGLEDLAARLFRDFGPRVVLAVTGRPVGEDKVQIDILARGTDGHEARRALALGGPEHLIMGRSATLALFTFFSFLRDL